MNEKFLARFDIFDRAKPKVVTTDFAVGLLKTGGLKVEKKVKKCFRSK